MSIFKLPLGLCDDLTSMIRGFWWGAENGKRKTAWLAWSELNLKKCCGGLGFKDLRLFNQAMLARQAWRLIAFPESLCARLLKAKYYPRGTLIDTAFCTNPSQTWQAISYGLELLKKGVIWRIGCGSQVRIWRDPWIPREHSLRVTTGQGRCRLKWVSDLLDQEGRDWDADKLANIFNRADIEAISRIKLPSRHAEDFLAWHMEKTGLFTVISAYNLAMRLATLEHSEASSSAPDGERKLWSRVWSGSVPPKVNIFIWNLVRDALPTRRAKYVRKLEISDQCTLCDREAETSFHAVVSCPQAYGLRLAMREHWLLPDEKQFANSGPDWLLLLLDNCSPVQQDLVKLVLWRAWTTHNNITHQSGPTGIYDGVQALLAMRSSLDQIEKGHDVGASRGKKGCEALTPGRRRGKENAEQADRTRWKVPPAGWYKINVDGSFDLNNGKAGAGVVARTSTGEVVFTAWRALFRCSDAAEAEARACVEGIRLAAEWAPGRVIIETDCARIVQAMQHGEDKSDITFVMAEARELTQLLLEWKVALVRRDCNAVANELAQLARRSTHTAVWLGQAPACVLDLLNADCTSPP